MTKPPSASDEARRERLSAALRENLKRRKAQVRSRAGAPAARGDGAVDADAGDAADADRDRRGQP